MFFKRYEFGDLAVYYAETPVEGNLTSAGLAIYPVGVEVDPKKLNLQPMVQVAFTGDRSLIDHTRGLTMRNHDSSCLKIVRQTQFSSGQLNTYLTDGQGNDYVHRLLYDRRTGVLTLNVRYENHTKTTRTLEMLSSFCISGIASPDMNTRSFLLHRMKSSWSRECRLVTDSFESLAFEPSWANFVPRVEKWGEVGSTPNRGYFPFGALEDRASGITWGVMQEAPFSWQMELYEDGNTCSLSGGPADFETGHWRKNIAPNGFFVSPCARLAVKRGGVNEVCNALVHEADSRLHVPADEEEMPVIYNEYCSSWGKPTADKVEKQAALLTGLDIAYFVIDCGWYQKAEGKDWTTTMGDWNVDKDAFPDLRGTVQKINALGMKAGIWFEFEIAGKDSVLFSFEDQLLKAGGYPLQSKNRRFLDLRRPDVKEYLQVKFVDFLREHGFSYLKIDYNDNYGVGCDGAESLGEGGRQVAEESLLFLDRLREDVRGLVIENCSSGGSRIEPYRMNKVSMCSFSDAHECPEIPLVAANVSRVIPARQSQIWAVIRKNEPDSRTVYSLCAAMMGRICLSGDVSCRKKEKFAVIREGLDFYREAAEIVRRGDITLIDCNVPFYRAPVGRQIYVKEYRERKLVIIHILEGAHTVEYPLDGYEVKRAFTDLPYTADGVLRVEGENFRAAAFLLERA